MAPADPVDVVDVIVVGAGVVGLSTAKHCAASGARVIVLDAESPGGVSSRAAAGVAIASCRLLDDPGMLSFAAEAKSVRASELDSLGDGGVRRGQGIVRLANDAAARSAMEAKASRVP